MASSDRGQFSSRFGFIMAAAGSAVGLGNVWGFPTQTASNGGAAFLLIYLLMMALLAFPMLVAELTIGRYGQSNPIGSLRKIWTNNRLLAVFFGTTAMLTASMILSFYAILAGWLIGFGISPIMKLIGLQQFSEWLITFGTGRNVLLTVIFMLMTVFVVRRGVADGIEKWSSRLMPVLFALFLVLIIYIFTQDGALDGLRMYLVPNWEHVNGGLVVNAMGQAFFSLSLGVGAMMVYGSYLSKDVNIPKTAGQVAIIDTGVAFFAGLLILPAMFVAKANGVQIFSETGELISSGNLVFTVLPSLFDSMGLVGEVVGVAFFALMVIAALTSSIAMLEVPVSCLQEELKIKREKSAIILGAVILLFSVLIAANFDTLFDWVATASTMYMQPLLGVVWAVVIGWVWSRNALLKEIQQGNPEIEKTWFWRIWPIYVKVVCPIAIIMVFAYPFL
ncbi:Sodium:neurotransmitter symporter family protein [Vibrio mediterranei]|uniref:Sodium-dependent transporter n=1 Tax=Vibrio mediterranei TaxID=689 RepID=A0ABX5DHN6_9VIBR|nr:sodium-dependent transporter [Vibrio mediterranei]MCG9657333.1 sodium-dependent transporter [Vibrio mediterranei]MCG9665001.1 sodium-dependent transporter [Vibrio mediterranei]PCD89850.1 sodium-dependent transporter [Vibrio mediterranei]PRQ69239.1 sodium-dependent transporter [Vibrio mediterranei]PTC04378.1 sodium-dependent transporter [Vibrio mediterranei]